MSEIPEKIPGLLRYNYQDSLPFNATVFIKLHFEKTQHSFNTEYTPIRRYSGRPLTKALALMSRNSALADFSATLTSSGSAVSAPIHSAELVAEALVPEASDTIPPTVICDEEHRLALLSTFGTLKINNTGSVASRPRQGIEVLNNLAPPIRSNAKRGVDDCALAIMVVPEKRNWFNCTAYTPDLIRVLPPKQQASVCYH
jgi:hypothetical protein